MKIHESDYKDENYHVDRYGDEIHVVLTYPNIPENGCRYVVVDQESSRASDGIRLHYDYDRDGFVVEQATIFEWDADDEVMDNGWVEVAFIQSWASEKKPERPE